MKRTAFSACLVLFTFWLLALPADARKPNSAPQSRRPSFSSAPGGSSVPSAAATRRGGISDTRSSLWGRDLSAERRETVRVRNQQQRMEQADHLRGIGERNGNTRLGETASRFEQRQVGPPAATEEVEVNPYEGIEIPPVDSSSEEADATSRPGRKPSWVERFRSWRPWRR
ncbi:MAG: hypothetical protein GTO62_12115 [Planctomycetales bacterium]|nr:hypothetical protein [Planctomycetales bacterium]NIP69988.1 hypothetical protein [Planctomycetales bacterium]